MISNFKQLMFEHFIDELQESFDITSTDYGTNWPVDNKQFATKNATYFKFNNFCVRVNCTIIGDVIGFKFSTAPIGKMTRSIAELTFSTAKEFDEYVPNVQELFSKAIYVLTEFVKDHEEISQVVFQGANEKLKSIYNILVRKKFFLDKIKSYGFEYSLEKTVENEAHTFVKV